jgi:uncharacterized protein
LIKDKLHWLTVFSVAILTPIFLSCDSDKNSNPSQTTAITIDDRSLEEENPSDASQQFQLGMQYMNGEGSLERNEAEGIKWIERAATQGYDDAEFELGERYWEGKGVGQDFVIGAKWLNKSSDKDNPMAQMILAEAYSKGLVIPKNDKEAIRLSRILAGPFPSYGTILGDYYAEGIAVPLDHKIAADWFRKAAEYGYEGGQMRLAYCYANGQGVPKSDVDALIWFQKAAEQGNPNAQKAVGHRYRDGLGVQKNLMEAAKWYQLAAAQGSADAQGALGQCYLNGWGVNEDKAEAARWFRKSAEQDQAVSQGFLGMCYSRGDGVPMDNTLAYMWLNLAAASGREVNTELRDQFAKLRDRVAESMSETEISEAQRMSREWHKAHNKFDE